MVRCCFYQSPNPLWPPPAGVQLDDELRFHFERQIAENVAAGMSPDEARYAAMRAFGNPALRARPGARHLELDLARIAAARRALQYPHPPSHAGFRSHRHPRHRARHRRQCCAVHGGAQRSPQAPAVPRPGPAGFDLRARHGRQSSGLEFLPAGRRGQHEGVAAGRAGPGGDGVFVSVAGLQPLRRGRQAARADRCFLVLLKFFPNAWRAADSGAQFFGR